MIFGIFVFNLVVSSFVFVTVPGFVFFPLSAGFLLYRAFLWGLLVYALPVWAFVAALPIIVLEGEAYVSAAVGGTIIGVSWVKPLWLHRGDRLSRREALKAALKECLGIYVLVIILLFAAAVVETATILLVTS